MSLVATSSSCFSVVADPVQCHFDTTADSSSSPVSSATLQDVATIMPSEASTQSYLSTTVGNLSEPLQVINRPPQQLEGTPSGTSTHSSLFCTEQQSKLYSSIKHYSTVENCQQQQEQQQSFVSEKRAQADCLRSCVCFDKKGHELLESTYCPVIHKPESVEESTISQNDDDDTTNICNITTILNPILHAKINATVPEAGQQSFLLNTILKEQQQPAELSSERYQKNYTAADNTESDFNTTPKKIQTNKNNSFCELQQQQLSSTTSCLIESSKTKIIVDNKSNESLQHSDTKITLPTSFENKIEKTALTLLNCKNTQKENGKCESVIVGDNDTCRGICLEEEENKIKSQAPAAGEFSSVHETIKRMVDQNKSEDEDKKKEAEQEKQQQLEKNINGSHNKLDTLQEDISSTDETTPNMKQNDTHVTYWNEQENRNSILSLTSPVSVQQPPPHFSNLKNDVLRDFHEKRLYLFLDYDGTLTPIVKNPWEATLSPFVRQFLFDLASDSKNLVTVGIVTGRALASVKNFVQIVASENLNFIYAASHGFHIEAAGKMLHHRVGSRYIPILKEASSKVEVALKNIPGVTLEDNEFSVSVHYRNSPEGSEEIVERIIMDTLTLFPALKMTRGKKVFELRINVTWDKGRAVFWLLNAMRVDPFGTQTRVIYIGDDLTDEDAFRAVRRIKNSLTVLVSDTPGSRPTAATCFVNDPNEVAKLLQIFLNLVRGFPD